MRKMAEGRIALACAVYLLSTAVFAFVEDLDDTFKETRKDDVWLVDFYAPWCGYCKKLEPLWHEVGAELRSSGSPVRVGKIDATAFTGVASEFGVRGYPTIKLIKGEMSYNYKGPRTKDAIIEFANRVSGPVVRPLPSKQMFDHVMKRHDVLFVYVGGGSPLKDKYVEVASEMIVHTHFFSASDSVLPKEVTLNEVPTVVVFKDGGYFVYDENADGNLSSWIARERFLAYLPIDGFTLYDLGETGKLVVIAVVEGKSPTEECVRLKILVQKVATEHRDQYSKNVQFGHMDGNEYINSLIMGDVAVPSVIILNASNEQYFLPQGPIETTDELMTFVDSVLDGKAKAHGGDGFFQRLKRLAFDAKSTVLSVFHSSPILACFLFGLPACVLSLMCYGICTASTSDDAGEDLDVLGREGLTDEEEEEEGGEGQRKAILSDCPNEAAEQEPDKSSTEKKID